MKELLKEEIKTTPILIGAAEVAELLGIKRSRAYKVIHELNAKLQADGKVTNCGRINKQYLIENFSG